MSLLSAILLPQLEKELINVEPQVAEFILTQTKILASELIGWAEGKLIAHEQKGENHASS